MVNSIYKLQCPANLGHYKQVQGAFVQGLGFYLSEEYRYDADNGQVCHLWSPQLRVCLWSLVICKTEMSCFKVCAPLCGVSMIPLTWALFLHNSLLYHPSMEARCFSFNVITGSACAALFQLQLVTDSTWDYKIPSSKDIPHDFRASLLPNSSNPSGFLRSKVWKFCWGLSSYAILMCGDGDD